MSATRREFAVGLVATAAPTSAVAEAAPRWAIDLFEAAAAVDVPDHIQFVETRGRSSIGKGSGVYKRAPPPPSGQGGPEFLRTRNGLWYELDVGDGVDVTSLGAVGDGVHDDTAAFQAAADLINRLGGGELIIPRGIYLWGRQDTAGRKGLGYAFRGQDLIFIRNCRRPVVVRAAGAVIRTKPGLRFGSFDPLSGVPRTEPAPFLDPDWTAGIGSALRLEHNADVSIEGPLDLDGAIDKAVIGGAWGDMGIQLRHLGVLAMSNKALRMRNVWAHHFGLDGCMIGWTALTTAAPIYTHRLENCRFTHNGRQGLSWIGGNSLECRNCEFSFTGQNGAVVSGPGAGLDIEAEESICRNGHFTRCRFEGNEGVGMVADSGDTADCRFDQSIFIGVRRWAAWPAKPRFSFLHCRFEGPIVNVYGSKERPEDATEFDQCTLLHSGAIHCREGILYPHRSDLTSAFNARLSRCFVDGGKQGLPDCAGGRDGLIWTDSYLVTSTDEPFYTKGIFRGTCSLNWTGKGSWDPANGAMVQGVLYVNGQLLSGA